ncbi:MAG: peptidylprolyl isomerase, partial [Defluviitaleaceae bacterium]|nr:peptidylprolyl isomerase [Defluviitaleaceae bacterium]
TPTPAPTPPREDGRAPTANPWTTPADLQARPPVTLQLTPVVAGEELVVLHTNHGDITVRLFPQAAPIAVENFLTHARNGFYDGLIFHRVIEDFMIQGGCAQGTGMGGESIWGEGFGPEHNHDLWHFNGALAMAQSRLANSIGSQFYIVHSHGLHPQFARDFNLMLDELYDDEFSHGVTFGQAFPREMLEHFLEVGGTPFLDFPFNSDGPNFGHTVFGQVIEGMDVVNAIAATPTGANDRPVEDVIIERTSIITAQG